MLLVSKISSVKLRLLALVAAAAGLAGLTLASSTDAIRLVPPVMAWAAFGVIYGLVAGVVRR